MNISEIIIPDLEEPFISASLAFGFSRLELRAGRGLRRSAEIQQPQNTQHDEQNWPGPSNSPSRQKLVDARGLSRCAQNIHAIGDDRLDAVRRAIPFEHGEFGMMQSRALAVAIGMASWKMRGSPAASSFFIANSGEVWR